MLSNEENELLTRVGPGTLMGNLLRRYWTPALLSAEVAEVGGAPARVRLLGEDLVAFRDTSGKVGLLKEHCPHRGTSLHFGRNEACALRCVYHGWAFDREGNCVDMPSEPRPFADRIKATAYPVHESGGIVWTYMGPRETMGPFRDFGTESLADEVVSATRQETACSWLQSMEGIVDTAHISFLHQFAAVDEIPDDGTDAPGYPSSAMSWRFWRHDRSPRLEIEDTWYGFRYAGLRSTPNRHVHARVTACCLPYSLVVAAIPFSTRHGIRVPIDDERSNCFQLVTHPPANPHGYGGIDQWGVSPFTAPFRTARNTVLPRGLRLDNDFGIDRAAQRSYSFSGVSDFNSQDFMVTESMGPIYDRTEEHLGSTDVAVIRLRTVLLEAARALAQGKEPPALHGDFTGIRGAEKVLEAGEGWRGLGTDDDPVVREALGLAPLEAAG